jgi:hypothetical protein
MDGVLKTKIGWTDANGATKSQYWDAAIPNHAMHLPFADLTKLR